MVAKAVLKTSEINSRVGSSPSSRTQKVSEMRPFSFKQIHNKSISCHMSQKLSLKFNQSNFVEFLNKFTDLTSIDDVVKMKIEQDEILMYSVISNETSITAFKGYTLKTKDFIDNFDRDETFDFIITSANKFGKNLKFFNPDKIIKLDLVSKPLPDDDTVMHIRTAQFTNDKLKISTIGGEQYRIKDLQKSTLNARLNPKNSKWNFKVSNNDFNSIKKLSSINNEDRILNITVDNGKVTFNETSKWELEVDNVKQNNANLIFSKKYLSNINDDDELINFYVFENFILVKDKDSNLMLSFEQDFTNED